MEEDKAVESFIQDTYVVEPTQISITWQCSYINLQKSNVTGSYNTYP